MSVDHIMAVLPLVPSGPIVPTPLISLTNVSGLFSPTMDLSSAPNIPNALDMVADYSSSALRTWFVDTMPSATNIVFTPALGSLSSYINTLNGLRQIDTTKQFDEKMLDWLHTLLITFTNGTATFSALFVAV